MHPRTILFNVEAQDVKCPPPIPLRIDVAKAAEIVIRAADRDRRTRTGSCERPCADDLE
jgi:hypothetical protein